MVELRVEDVSAFRPSVRMDPELFWELLLRSGLRLAKNDTWYRKALNSFLKLALIQRLLATGGGR